MSQNIYFCIKTRDGRYMPVQDYIKTLELALEEEMKKKK